MDKKRKVTWKPLLRSYPMPGYLLLLYALLLVTLGWCCGQRWEDRGHAPTSVAKLPPKTSTERIASALPLAPASATNQEAHVVTDTPLAANELPPLRYSAHVFTSNEQERSITLNGKIYRQGDSVMNNLLVEQIQQDVTIFDFNGEVFVLDALEDWPGGIVDNNREESE